MILLGLITAWAIGHAFFECWAWVEHFRRWYRNPRGGFTSLDRGITPRPYLYLVPETRPIVFGRIQTEPMSRLTLVE